MQECYGVRAPDSEGFWEPRSGVSQVPSEWIQLWFDFCALWSLIGFKQGFLWFISILWQLQVAEGLFSRFGKIQVGPGVCWCRRESKNSVNGADSCCPVAGEQRIGSKGGDFDQIYVCVGFIGCSLCCHGSWVRVQVECNIVKRRCDEHYKLAVTLIVGYVV